MNEQKNKRTEVEWNLWVHCESIINSISWFVPLNVTLLSAGQAPSELHRYQHKR